MRLPPYPYWPSMSWQWIVGRRLLERQSDLTCFWKFHSSWFSYYGALALVYSGPKKNSNTNGGLCKPYCSAIRYRFRLPWRAARESRKALWAFGDIAVKMLSARSKLDLQSQGAACAPGVIKVLLNGLRIHHVIAWTDANGRTERPVAERKCQLLPQGLTLLRARRQDRSPTRSLENEQHIWHIGHCTRAPAARAGRRLAWYFRHISRRRSCRSAAQRPRQKLNRV